jgi:Plasma-membrane choline transporter
MHVTTSGVIGTWWWVPEEASSFCSSALSDSLVRATTYSFGSICFGSFLVALVQALRALERHARDSDDLQILSCIIQCILSCIQGIIESLNRWAYGTGFTFALQCWLCASFFNFFLLIVFSIHVSVHSVCWSLWLFVP